MNFLVIVKVSDPSKETLLKESLYQMRSNFVFEAAPDPPPPRMVWTVDVRNVRFNFIVVFALHLQIGLPGIITRQVAPSLVDFPAMSSSSLFVSFLTVYSFINFVNFTISFIFSCCCFRAQSSPH